MGTGDGLGGGQTNGTSAEGTQRGQRGGRSQRGGGGERS